MIRGAVGKERHQLEPIEEEEAFIFQRLCCGTKELA